MNDYCDIVAVSSAVGTTIRQIFKSVNVGLLVNCMFSNLHNFARWMDPGGALLCDVKRKKLR